MFWLLAGLLAAVTLVALLPPLLRDRPAGGASSDAVNLDIHRDQLRALEADLAAGVLAAEHYQSARREIEKRLLEDTRPEEPAQASGPGRSIAVAITLAVVIPIGAFATYLAIGEPRAVNPQAARSAAAAGADPRQFAAMVERLAARMKSQPDDAEGWAMLGRSWAVLGRYGESAAAYAEAVARMPDNAQVLVDYADALAMSNGSSLAGEPERLLARALRADPSNVKALALAGSAAFQRREFAAAVRYWERALPLAQDDPEFAASLRSSIEQARAQRAAPGARPGASK